MLDKIITSIAVEHNLRKISSKGSIRSLFGEERMTLHSIIAERIFQGYLLNFLFDNSGFIRIAGHGRNFPQKMLEKYNHGAFSVAFDLQYLVKVAGIKGDLQVKEERIFDYHGNFSRLKEKDKEKVQRRLQATIDAYNARYGFDLHPAGFFAGEI